MALTGREMRPCWPQKVAVCNVKKFLPRHVKNSLPCGCKITLPRTDGHHISHDRVDIRPILDLYIVFFQVVAHHFPKSCFLWGIFFLCHKINLQTGKSILHQFEGLHKLWDTPIDLKKASLSTGPT